MGRRKPVPPPHPTECGHADEFERVGMLEVDGIARPAYLCWRCEKDYEQRHPIPCVGCGGFAPRPGWPGEFNSPVGYNGGGHHRGHWFPWCPECLQPMGVTCMDCYTHSEHVCGQPPQMAEGAAERLAHRYWHFCHQYPIFGIGLRHLLGARDWPGYSGPNVSQACDMSIADLSALPAAVSLWPSLEAAQEAIQPFIDEFEGREKVKRADEERKRADEERKRAAEEAKRNAPSQLALAL